MTKSQSINNQGSVAWMDIFDQMEANLSHECNDWRQNTETLLIL